MNGFLSKFKKSALGASGVEYGLAVALVVMIALVALETTGNSVSNTIGVAGDKVEAIKSEVVDGAYSGGGTGGGETAGTGDEDTVNVPPFLVFANVDGASFSTPYDSETVIVPAQAAGKSATVTGDASAELVINGMASGTTFTLSGGETLALSMVSGSSFNSRKTATVTVGDETKTWSVNTLNAQAYSFSGAVEEFVVPDGVTSVTVKAWGAGGGGGGINGANKGGAGGGGAFVTGTIPTTPGATLALTVGEGGHAPTATRYVAFGNGGASGTAQDGSSSRGGGGGGATYVLDGSTILVAAGAGGGGGGGAASFGIGGAGGAGGLASGENGGYLSASFAARIGLGASQAAGGVAGASAAPAGNGDQLSGGTPEDSYGRSGGGSGYFGGGGGDYYSGAGGGSSYIVGGFISGSSSGSGINPGGSSYADYPYNGVGTGGSVGVNGGNGYLLLIWAGATEYTGGSTGGTGGTGEQSGTDDVEFMAFSNVTDADASSSYESNAVVVPASAAGKTASLTGDASAYIVLDGTPSGRSVTLAGGEMLSIVMMSSDTSESLVSVSITVGAETDTWTVTTAVDTTPDAIVFMDTNGVDLETVVTSNTVNISGFGGELPLIVSDGVELIIDGTPTGGNLAVVTAGQTLALRMTSSASGATGVQANGTLGDIAFSWIVTTKAGSGRQAFSYTGGTQLFTVPSGVAAISVKAWGAGGGGGHDSGSYGGAGGYVYDTQVPVTPGDTLVVIVGGPGRFGGGNSGGSGGGLSGVFSNGVVTQDSALTIAGGGGGGNYYGSGSANNYGMGGGGSSGQATTWRPDITGGPGTQSSGGSLGVGGNAGFLGTAGGALQGGRGSGTAATPASVSGGFGGGGSNGSGPSYEGGGGGGGYFGGGGGGGAGNAGAGGGGSGHTSGLAVYNLAGSGRYVANVGTSDPDYPGAIGNGGDLLKDNAQAGYVVILW